MSSQLRVSIATCLLGSAGEFRPLGFDMNNDELAFERTVQAYLSEGLHANRGINAEEYRSLCRAAWDGCSTSPGFPVKSLIDPLRAAEAWLQNSRQEYIHWRAGDALESSGEQSTQIRCSAVGLIKADFSTTENDAPRASEHKEPEVIETRRYILGVFDVLGFSALLARKGLASVHALYERLIAEAVTRDAMSTVNIVRLSKTDMCSMYFSLPVKHAHFSDSILLWVPLVQHFLSPFMARCADMVSEALRLGLPLRGALAVGPAIMHGPSGTFIGSPIVEAARLEHAQDWLGVALGSSLLAHDVSREFDPHLVLPYRIPAKKGTPGVLSGYVLDWPSRYRARYKESPTGAIRALNTSTSHARYYENAVKFAEFSEGPVFRSEGLHPLGLERLAAAAAEAHAKHAPFDPQVSALT